MNILDIINRSNAGKALTPTERAALKAALGVLITFVSLLLPYLNDILAGKYQIDYVHVIEVLITAMVLAGMSKYVSALSPAQQDIAKRLQDEADELTRGEAGSIANIAQAMQSNAKAIHDAGYTTEQAMKALASQPLVLPGAATNFPIITNTSQENLTIPPTD